MQITTTATIIVLELGRRLGASFESATSADAVDTAAVGILQPLRLDRHPQPTHHGGACNGGQNENGNNDQIGDKLVLVARRARGRRIRRWTIGVEKCLVQGAFVDQILLAHRHRIQTLVVEACSRLRFGVTRPLYAITSIVAGATQQFGIVQV